MTFVKWHILWLCSGQAFGQRGPAGPGGRSGRSSHRAA